MGVCITSLDGGSTLGHAMSIDINLSTSSGYVAAYKKPIPPPSEWPNIDTAFQLKYFTIRLTTSRLSHQM